MTHQRRNALDQGQDYGDDHHDHDHRAHLTSRSIVARLRHGLTTAVGAHHHHDAAESIDHELEATRDGRRALVVSVAVLMVTCAIQAVVVALSGSVALLGDTLHNLIDALTAIPLLIAFRLAARPPTHRYTYGYGRAEDIAGIFVVAMIALSALLAAYQSFDRLLHPRDVTHLWAVAAAGVVGFAGNELVAVHRVRVGRRIGSAALVADGLHARADGLTSLAVVAGAAGVSLGWRAADAVVGLAIAVAIVAVLRSAVLQTAARLMDAVDPHLVDDASAAITDVDGVVAIRELRVRWIGHTLRAEVDLAVDPDLTLADAHEVAHHAEAHLLTRVPRLTAATVHTSPADAHS
jgi:cation diffusion facilitator family transporter